jgi:hypothetical protein
MQRRLVSCCPQFGEDEIHSRRKLGLIATSTPFITGRPVTLFHNQNIYDSGAVGIALKKPKSRSIARTEFMDAVTLSPPMTVTQ